jgi:hypothetical protein
MAAFNFQTQKSLFEFSFGSEHQIVGEEVSAQIRESSTLRATFPKQDIDRLLNMPECAGICFYLAPGANDTQVMVAVGINSRERILSDVMEGYFCLECRHGEISRENNFDTEIKASVNHVLGQDTFGSPSGFFKKNYTADMLNSLLLSRDKLQVDVSGISYDDDSIAPGMYHTFAISTLDANDEMSDSVLLNMLPCPPNCGSGGYDTQFIS